MVTPLEWSLVYLFQFCPQSFIKLLEAEVLGIIQIMENALFQDPHCILNRALVLRLLDLGRENDGMIMLCPLRIIFVHNLRCVPEAPDAFPGPVHALARSP